jgi:hypothetical protein
MMFALVTATAALFSTEPETERRRMQRGGSSSSSSGGSWGLDVTNVLPKSEFIKMHKTIATMYPLDLSWGTTNAPQFGGHSDDDSATTGDVADAYSGSFATIGDNIGGAATTNTLQSGQSVWLNDFTGAAHAHCYSLAVEGEEEEHNFRVCNAMEMQAITALVTIPLGRRVMTFASSDGDDFETGKTMFKVKKGDSAVELSSYGYSYDYDYDWSYDYDGSGGSWAMQVYEGPDNENNMDDVDQGLLVYCCSGEYSVYNGDGPSRR